MLEKSFGLFFFLKQPKNQKSDERYVYLRITVNGSAKEDSPGSGKSYFIIRHVITQHIRKGFSMFVYDFKFDDLSVIVYNT